MRILKLLLALGSVAGATSITSAVGGNPNPLLTTGDIWAGTTNGAPTNLPAGASGTFLGSNGIGIAPTYQLINYSSLTGTVPTWNQSTTGSAATLTTGRTISASGDATGTSAAFNGSAAVTVPLTLATVNSNTGACGDASHVCQTTLNGKGLATAATAVAITPAAIGAQAALSGLTNNVLTKGNGTTGIQSSSITDNGATVSTTEGLSAGSFYVPAGGPINLGSDEIENVTFAGTGFTDVQSGDWLFYDYSPSNQGAIRLGVGTTSSASTLRISYAGIRSVGADTIGSGSGTAILTSGVVSTLSGTNLVLGNGSTIPQSTFQAAGSYQPLENQRLSTTNSPTFATVAAYGTTNTGAINNGPYFLLYNSSADVGWQAQLGSSTTLDFWSRSSGTWGSAPKIKFPLAGLGAGIVQSDVSGLFSSNYTVPATTTFSATGTAITAPNGDISRNGDLFASTVTSSGTAVTLTNSSAEIQVITTPGFTYTLPASPTTGRRFTFCSRGTSISINPNGKTLWSPGPSSGTGTISVTSYGYINVFFDGTVWYLDRS